MKLRKFVFVFLAVMALAVASVSITLAAPRGQEAPGSSGDTPGSTGAAPGNGAEATGDRPVAQHRPDKPAKAFLGLITKNLGDRERALLEVPHDVSGVLVIGTRPASPAAEAGLHRGDVVSSVAGIEITTPKELQRVVSSKSPGDEVDLTYWREGALHTVGIFLGDQADHRRPQIPAWLNHLHRFLNAFPNTVDASFRVLDADGNVHVYEITPGTVLAVGENGLLIETRLGEEVRVELVDGSVVIKGHHRIELGDLEEGMHVVVLEIDDAVKAVVVVRARPDQDGRVRPRDIEAIEENPRKAIVREFQEHMKKLIEARRADPDRDGVQERIEKLMERIRELQERLAEVTDGDDDSADDDSDGDDAGGTGDVTGDTIAA